MSDELEPKPYEVGYVLAIAVATTGKVKLPPEAEQAVVLALRGHHKGRLASRRAEGANARWERSRNAKKEDGKGKPKPPTSK